MPAERIRHPRIGVPGHPTARAALALAAGLSLAACAGSYSPGRAAETAPAPAPAAPEPGSPRPGVDWPSFRGVMAGGISEGRPLAERWDVAAATNVLWKTAIPGLAHSSPVIWGDVVFVTSALGPDDAQLKVGLYGAIAPVPDEGEHRFNVYALDKRTGAILWERTAHAGPPRFKRHTKSTHANPTPATDGRHLAVFFGSEGLYLYDLDGRLIWKKDLGALDTGYWMVPAAQWGFGSSPVIHGDRVIVQCDVQGGGFLAAFRLSDGAELWRTPRADVPTWSTPTVHTQGDEAVVVVNGWKHIGGYDAATGAEIWRMKGGGDIPVPTPIVYDGLVFITNAHGGPSPIYAIRAGATGEIVTGEDAPASPHIAWMAPRGGAYMQTPLAYRGHLYVCRDNGVLTVHEAATGSVTHTGRLGDGVAGFTASAVAGDGKLYYTAETGRVHVLRAGAVPEPIGDNDLGEVAMATPAVSEGVLYFRTRGHLVAIGPGTAR